MENKIKAVIFDQDGLMFDTERMSAKAWDLAGAELGLKVEEAFLATVRGMNFRDAEVRFQKEFGDVADWRELRRRKWAQFDRMREVAPVPVKTGLRELLAYLREHDYKIALATASTMEYSMKNLEEAGIADYFEALITGDQIGRSKPDPEIFLTAAAALGEEPRCCLVLEDSLNGVEAGIRGGFNTIMVPDLTQPSEELRGRVTKVCGSLLDVKDWLEGAVH